MTIKRAQAAALGALLATSMVGKSARADEPNPDPVELYDYSGTPRDGVLSGGYLGLDFGVVAIDEAVRERVGIGLGPAFAFRLGAVLWDHWVLGVGLAIYSPAEHRPTSEQVIVCTTLNGQSLGCDPPSRQESTVAGAFSSFETGYQHRFRPWLSTSFTPTALIGVAAELHPPTRGVGCEGCPDSVALPVSTSGFYVAPLFRVTIGESGHYAVVARSQLFFTGNLTHFTTLGAEVGLP